MRIAITREVGAAIARCELTHLARAPIDVGRARAQHAAYEEQLRALGCTVRRLPEAPDLPDAVFVEDCAIVLDDLAIITRPGAASRRPETAAIEQALAPLRPLKRISPPGTIDGGDALRVGTTVFIGVSSRTNEAAADELRAYVEPLGYTVVPVEVRGCLHLKSAVTEVAPRALLVNRAWLPGDAFRDFDCIDVDPGEPFAANALRIGDSIIYPAAFPKTRARLEARGLDVREVDVSELAKAEGAVTCCCVIVEA